MGMQMKVMIAGSRGIRDFDLTNYIPSETSLIISGGAVGIDTVAEKYADEHKLSKFIIRPEYKKYGRSAPLKRNETMVDMADLIIVIWDGISRGTKYTIRYAQKKKKQLIIIMSP